MATTEFKVRGMVFTMKTRKEKTRTVVYLVIPKQLGGLIVDIEDVKLNANMHIMAFGIFTVMGADEKTIKEVADFIDREKAAA